MNTATPHGNIIPLHMVDPTHHILEDIRRPDIFERLVQSAPDLIYTVNNYGIFSFVNDRSMELTEYTREELLNMHYLELVDPAYLPMVKNYYLRQIVRGPEISYLEFPMMTKTGKRIWVGQKVIVHLASPMMGFEAIARDISDKKNAEEELMQMREERKNVFERAVQGMFQSSVDGMLISANPELVSLLGYDSIEELRAINLSDLYVDREDRERLHLLLSTEGRALNIELKLKRKDGQVITVLEHSRAVVNEKGEIAMYEGIMEDITSQKTIDLQTQLQAEALQSSEKTLRELHEIKNKMYSIVSHDLRSPFASIIGFSNLLLQEYDRLSREEHIEFITYIRDSARDQLQFVNDLLDFTKLDSGQARVEMKDLNMPCLVNGVIQASLQPAREKGITINSTLPKNFSLRGDERWIQQLFSNLISNAIKFTGTNGKVTISLNSMTEENCIIDITDTGVGIPADVIPRLFRIEEKYSTPGTNGERGHGLGLPVCFEIMVNHGGALSLESVAGKGTTVHLVFPRAFALAQSNILIVDDEPTVRTLHAQYVELSFPSCKAFQAADGLEAMRLVEELHPRVIITDFSMPNMNGMELMRNLKINPKTSDIPVIVITGEDSSATHESFLLNGARAVLAKPIHPCEFHAIFKKVLEG